MVNYVKLLNAALFVIVNMHSEWNTRTDNVMEWFSGGACRLPGDSTPSTATEDKKNRSKL